MKTTRLTETDINRLVKKVLREQEQNEGIFDPIKDAYAGLKGVWRGDGYDYFKYLSSLSGYMKELKRLDKPNHNIIAKFPDLKNKITSSKMDSAKKQRIINAIDMAETHFNKYSQAIDVIESAISKKIN
jgi:mRNA-degrading endonuclease RelE of RelBE toxin-antitoxin system